MVERTMNHLKDTGMGYFRHMRHAMYISVLLIAAAACCAIHSVAPFVFEKTASRIITHLTDNVISRQIQR